MIELCFSILASDFAHLADEIATAERGGGTIVHVDVMDGHFVPNITFGPPMVKAIRPITRLPLDCHLMIEDPDAYIPAFAQDRDTPAGRALRAVHDHVVSVIGAQAMTPGNVAAELATIDVPVFLAAGDRDMTGPPHLLPADYPACRDLTLFVVETSGHHVFVAPGAAQLYRRTAHWLAGLTKDDR